MLPIKKIVLYKHGVGYFERQDKVKGDATIDLQFKASEMNDVLKSLTVLDLHGGIISSISYESTKPVEKQLEDIAIRLPEENALTGLLNQVKGAQVSVEVGAGSVEGVVTGIETVTRRQEEETTWTHYLNLLVEGSSIQAFDLLEVKRVTFLDTSLQKDLQHLLDTLISTKKKDLKRLTIFARGDGERSIVASYIVETPVWKTSYRVLLDEKETLIQGWALVDNTQDEDWEDVSLTLVAGLPISFVHDLYSPRYKRRPVVQVREEEAYAPPVLEEAVAGEMMLHDAVSEYDDEEYATMDLSRSRAAPPAPGMPPPPPGPMMQGMPAPAPAPARRPAMRREEALRKSVEVQTRTVEVGDLFSYEIENEVTVKRNQSALVPILQRPFSGKRVAVYNPELRDKNPMSAVQFENTTGMTLEGGPLTVLEQNTYVGEAMLETMKPAEERLVPFSVELGCLITKDSDSDLEDVHLARIHRGTLHLHRYRIDKSIYLIKSKLERELTLFLEHRFNASYKLVDTPKPVEKTESFYRFKVEVPPGKTTRFVVAEKGDVYESYHVQNVTREQAAIWVSKRYIDDKTKEALDGLMSLNEKVADLEHWIRERTQEIEQIFANQERLRDNLGALGNTRDEQRLKERYIGELSKEEDKLAAMREQIQAWKEEKAKLQEKVNTTVRKMEVEVKVR